MPTSVADSQVRTALRRAAVRATYAPSVHNTQPWRMRAQRRTSCSIHADRPRQLPVLDPTAAAADISCGCALLNARVSLAADGVDVDVDRFPSPPTPTSLADAQPATRRRRRTPRWPRSTPCSSCARRTGAASPTTRCPLEVLDAARAGRRRARARLLHVVRDADQRLAVARLSQHADDIENLNPAYRAELRAWTTDDPRRGATACRTCAVPHVDGSAEDEVPDPRLRHPRLRRPARRRRTRRATSASSARAPPATARRTGCGPARRWSGCCSRSPGTASSPARSPRSPRCRRPGRELRARARPGRLPACAAAHRAGADHARLAPPAAGRRPGRGRLIAATARPTTRHYGCRAASASLQLSRRPEARARRADRPARRPGARGQARAGPAARAAARHRDRHRRPGAGAVLRNIVEAACELAGARYGALGVIGHDGGLEQFIHVGIDAETAARIGHLPEGKGLLGALISDPRPIRLEHMADDDRSAGLPARAPADGLVPRRADPRPRRGVRQPLPHRQRPRRVQRRGRGAGASRSRSAAGTAISNARLYEESRLQQRWLNASAEISAQLLSAERRGPAAHDRPPGHRHRRRRPRHRRPAHRRTATTLVVEVAFGDRRRRSARAAASRWPTRWPDRWSTTVAPLLRRTRSTPTDDSPWHVPSCDAGPADGPAARRTRPRMRGVLSLARGAGAGARSRASDLDDGRRLRQPRQRRPRTRRLPRGRAAAWSCSRTATASRGTCTTTSSRSCSRSGSAWRASPPCSGRTRRSANGCSSGSTTSTARSGGSAPASSRCAARSDAHDGRPARAILEIAGDLTPALGFPPHVAFAGPGRPRRRRGGWPTTSQACVREALTNVAKHAARDLGDGRRQRRAGELPWSPSPTTASAGAADAHAQRPGATCGARAERHGGTFELSAGRRRRHHR